VAAIAITHQRETIVGVDDAGSPVRPGIVWMDERSRDDVQHLRQVVGADSFHAITGKPLSLTPSISKILWVRRSEPDFFQRIERWLDVHAWLVRHFTGQDVTAVGSADPMGLIDISLGQWDDGLLAVAGLDQRSVPRLVPSGHIVGKLTNQQASVMGFPFPIPIVATAGDGQVAALGAGIRDLRTAYMNLGTAIVAGVVSRTAWKYLAFRTMVGAESGTYLLESDLKGGTFCIDWLSHKLLNGRVGVPQLEQNAASIRPGSEGLMWVPYLATAMNPYWDDNASGLVVGLRGDHGPAHIFRAILEGIAFEQRLQLEGIERVSHERIEIVRVLGGGAQSDLWCQILADVLNRPVVRTKQPETTSLGAAMLAAITLSALPSLSEAIHEMSKEDKAFEPGTSKDLYARLYSEVYSHLYPSVRTSMSNLTKILRNP